MQTDTFLDEIERTTQLDGAADFLLDRVGKTLANGPTATCSRASGSAIPAPAAHRHPDRMLDLRHDCSTSCRRGRAERPPRASSASARSARSRLRSRASPMRRRSRTPWSDESWQRMRVGIMHRDDVRVVVACRHKDHHARGVMWSLLGSTRRNRRWVARWQPRIGRVRRRACGTQVVPTTFALSLRTGTAVATGAYKPRRAHRKGIRPVYPAPAISAPVSFALGFEVEELTVAVLRGAARSPSRWMT